MAMSLQPEQSKYSRSRTMNMPNQASTSQWLRLPRITVPSGASESRSTLS
jgi:hypothetical protein